MGVPEDVMRGFVSREIRIRFPQYEGWDLQQIKSCRNSGFDFQVSRYYRGKKQYALISVSFNRKPTLDEVLPLKVDRSNHRVQVGSFLLAPQGADTSGICSAARVLSMNSFGFIGSDLVWLTKKKNAQRFSLEAAQEQ